ncbi:MAG: A/G-specific adenine glycosylase [Clostridia bacterium]|nr:A/G-specific adenine glycosylase [Clostridia bacterium]
MSQPIEIIKQLPSILLPWYAKEARALPWRKDKSPYHVWVSEIMLQQTRVEAVRNYYLRFMENFPTIEALAKADESLLFKLWEGLGYYNRARNLQKTAKIIAAAGGVFPNNYDDVLALPGIGTYTAGAICSICYDLPIAAVDGNVLRVISRLTADTTPIQLEKTKRDMANLLQQVYPIGNCGDFTQSLMELGAVVCTPKSPKCENCPAATICLAHKQNQTALYPTKAKKADKKIEQRTLFLLQCGDLFAIEQRGNKGLLAGLWQLPNISGSLTAEQAFNLATEFGTTPSELCREIHKSHIFTHLKWEMVCYHIRCTTTAKRFTWATQNELNHKYALPTAFRIFLEE